MGELSETGIEDFMSILGWKIGSADFEIMSEIDVLMVCRDSRNALTVGISPHCMFLGIILGRETCGFVAHNILCLWHMSITHRFARWSNMWTIVHHTSNIFHRMNNITIIVTICTNWTILLFYPTGHYILPRIPAPAHLLERLSADTWLFVLL